MKILSILILVALFMGMPAATSAQPNVVVVMTDDQEAESVEVMDAVENRLGGVGTEFRNAFSTFPLCCPARVTFLTGQYAHNHGVLDNHSPVGGFHRYRDERDDTSLAVAMNRVGYYTGYIGKYLNGYGEGSLPYQPPGWDSWKASVSGHFKPYNYKLYQNGDAVTYGDRPEDYQTDVYREHAVDFIERNRSRPFFLTVATGAPHTPFDGPPRYRDDFEGRALPKPPSFNEGNMGDKPGFMQKLSRLTDDEVANIRERYQDRLASLKAVDDLVGRLLTRLGELNELDNTLFIFTSDNGYLLGEHRFSGKFLLYEESAQIPLVVRGPGFPAIQSPRLAANIDVSPTILRTAGAAALVRQDGMALQDVVAEGSSRDILLENFRNPKDDSKSLGAKPGAGAKGIRTADGYSYLDHGADHSPELYDLSVDSFQVQSRHDNDAYNPIQRRLDDRLSVLKDCAGSECR